MGDWCGSVIQVGIKLIVNRRIEITDAEQGKKWDFTVLNIVPSKKAKKYYFFLRERCFFS
jgi:hypothetical protein